jgi:hypothetical protein
MAELHVDEAEEIEQSLLAEFPPEEWANAG